MSDTTWLVSFAVFRNGQWKVTMKRGKRTATAKHSVFKRAWEGAHAALALAEALPAAAQPSVKEGT